ncbi:GyrI-like domain-containing protein [bacterium]|nr:GyrI-like domain-containing protein [bacterium]
MTKIDFKKDLKLFYNPSKKEVTVVDVPQMIFLMIDGKGDPNTEDYQSAVETVFSVSYALKFMIKKSETDIDYTVMPLEGLWWADDMSDFTTGNCDAWLWTAMIMQPEYVTRPLFEEAKAQVAKKKYLPLLGDLRLTKFHEGKAAQIMHIGPYSEEGPTIEKIHNLISEHGGELCGKHHEIYLSDPRKTAPEKLKTILRQPFQ